MKSRVLKSLVRGSMATLVCAGALLAATTAFAQTEPRDSDPVYPCPPGSCPSTTPGGCTTASMIPGHGAGIAALAPALFGLALLARRRRSSKVG
jgi:uncharacterized protein (TIGR03382 family)